MGGCLIPLISLFWAPVFLIELAHVQGAEDRQRKTITAVGRLGFLDIDGSVGDLDTVGDRTAGGRRQHRDNGRRLPCRDWDATAAVADV